MSDVVADSAGLGQGATKSEAAPSEPSAEGSCGSGSATTEQEPAPATALPPPRPYVDLPISLGRLRTLRGWQVISWVLAVGWVLGVTHPSIIDVSQSTPPATPFHPAPNTLGRRGRA
eukprot:COSAG01_NODE_836_length_13206_cov_139.627375_19_plen_117_part_00